MARFREAVDIEAAATEVNAKSVKELELETAEKWASRAIACYNKYRETQDIAWRLRAEDYHHEALEHAALVKDGGSTVARLGSEISKVEINGEENEQLKFIGSCALVEVALELDDPVTLIEQSLTKEEFEIMLSHLDEYWARIMLQQAGSYLDLMTVLEKTAEELEVQIHPIVHQVIRQAMKGMQGPHYEPR